MSPIIEHYSSQLFSRQYTFSTEYVLLTTIFYNILLRHEGVRANHLAWFIKTQEINNLNMIPRLLNRYMTLKDLARMWIKTQSYFFLIYFLKRYTFNIELELLMQNLFRADSQRLWRMSRALWQCGNEICHGLVFFITNISFSILFAHFKEIFSIHLT